ncbi:hypothetical protein PF011_g18541 [Phytophthora fragariae]|uniref:Tyr recombinase domain-containing protein n=1 Tax=Phytophthora fragariae TaxID=53985 RepID=A0A6A3JCA2_9STRA|nr:hypothetical protein PF011_g18541 [Phytophthora fragariae]
MAAPARNGDPATRSFPHGQHFRRRLAIEDVVSKPQSTSANPAPLYVGAPVRPPAIGVSHPWGREHYSRRRIQALGEPNLRHQVPGRDRRLDTQQTSRYISPHGRLAIILREHSVATSSHKAYARAFDRWNQWLARRGVAWRTDIPLPDQLQLISDFIIDTALSGVGNGKPIQGSTVKTYLCGIRHFLQSAGSAFPSDHPQIRMLLRGLSRFDKAQQQRAPASVAILEACLRRLDLTDPADQALWGVLCLAFFFLLRRSEIMAITRTTFRWFALKGGEITVTDRDGLATNDPTAAASVHIRLSGSKTNQGGPSTPRLLNRSGHSHLCPVLGALLLAQACRGLPEDIPAAVFINRRGLLECVTAARVARTIKCAARTTGANPARFGTHSLRAGGATNMYRAGVDSITIQFHGRWRSDACKLYTRLCTESVAGIARKIVSGAKVSTTLQQERATSLERDADRHSAGLLL